MWKHEVALILLLISGLSWHPSQQLDAELSVQLIDRSSREPVQARAYLTNWRGLPCTPPGLITYDRGPEHHFIVPRSFNIRLPAGKYTLLIERGPEFRSSQLTLELRAGQQHRSVVRLERWIEMNRRGWYSGDLHNHRKINEMPALLAAEDLNLAPTITTLDPARQSGAPKTSSEGTIRQANPQHIFSVLDRDIDRPVDSPGGMGLLALRSPLPFDGYHLYPPSDLLCRLARDLGGYIDAQEILWREAPALVALNQLDTAGIIHDCFSPHGIDQPSYRSGLVTQGQPAYDRGTGIVHWGMDVYYRLLNVGFRLPISAGSGSGVTPSPLGYNRVYVHLDKSFSYQSWFEALSAGRSFATNGPMLFLRVNGIGPGSAISLYQSQMRPMRVRVEAASARPLDRLEIVYNGSVLKAVSDSSGSSTLKIDMRTVFPDVGWVVARCFEKPGKTIRFAHTSPVYLQRGQHARIVPEDVQFFLDWIEREIGHYTESGDFQAPEHRQDVLAFLKKARRVYEALLKLAHSQRPAAGTR